MPKNNEKTPRGRKSVNEKAQADIRLRELFDQDAITPWRASLIANVGYKYARQKFAEFAEQITAEKTEDWIDTNDRVRKRALEGISVKLGEAQTNLERIQVQLAEAKHMQRTGLDEAEEELKQLEVYQHIKNYLEHLDGKVFFAFITVMRKHLDQHSKYGFLQASLVQQERATITLKAELQQQYDAIEILPPPSAVLQAELETRIAAKQGLFKPAVPPQPIEQKKVKK